MEGVLVRYGTTSRLVAHISSRKSYNKFQYLTLKDFLKCRLVKRAPPSGIAVIFLAGLTDGLLALSYLSPLDKLLASKGIGLIQPLLSSSYRGYGTSTLTQDCLELDELLEWFSNPEDVGTTKFVLWGHSTGAQIAVCTC